MAFWNIIKLINIDFTSTILQHLPGEKYREVEGMLEIVEGMTEPSKQSHQTITKDLIEKYRDINTPPQVGIIQRRINQLFYNDTVINNLYIREQEVGNVDFAVYYPTGFQYLEEMDAFLKKINILTRTYRFIEY